VFTAAKVFSQEDHGELFEPGEDPHGRTFSDE